MGVTRWLERIDPAVWQEAARRMQSPPATSAEVTEFLAAFGKAPDEWMLDAFADSADDRAHRSSVLNSVLERAVTAESWHLGKAFSRGPLERLPRIMPALKPLRQIVDFEGINTHVPATCDGIDAGLFGCMSVDGTPTCLQSVSQFPSIAHVSAALRAVKAGALARVFGRRNDAAVLAEELEAAGVDDCWIALRTALEVTERHGHLLGLGMSA